MINPALSTVGEFRDPIARVGGPGGLLYRSAKLVNASKRDKEQLEWVLFGGQIIDLRTPGRASQEPDPELTEVANVRISLPPTAYVSYDKILTEHTGTLREIMRQIVGCSGPTLVHCTEGKDRTGIVVALVMFAAEYPLEAIREEFLTTVGALEENWDLMLSAMGPNPYAWVRSDSGLGMSYAEQDSSF